MVRLRDKFGGQVLATPRAEFWVILKLDGTQAHKTANVRFLITSKMAKSSSTERAFFHNVTQGLTCKVKTRLSAATERNKSAVTDNTISLNHVIDWDHAKVTDRVSDRMDQRWIRKAIHNSSLILKTCHEFSKDLRKIFITSCKFCYVNFESLIYEFVALNQSQRVVTGPGGAHRCTPIICFCCCQWLPTYQCKHPQIN